MKKSQFIIAVLLVLSIIGSIATGYFYLQADKAKRRFEIRREKIKMLTLEINKEKQANKASREKIQALTKKVDDLAKTKEAKSVSGNTVVTAPSANQVIASPVNVSGRVIAFENSVNLRIKDGDGKVLAETHATATGSMGQLSDFTVSVPFVKPSQNKGTLEVFQISAKDGAEQDKVIIPVLFGGKAH